MREQLGEIKKLGTTMLICEHNVGLATALSDRAYVMDKGMIRYQGTIAGIAKERRGQEEVSHGLNLIFRHTNSIPRVKANAFNRFRCSLICSGRCLMKGIPMEEMFYPLLSSRWWLTGLPERSRIGS